MARASSLRGSSLTLGKMKVFEALVIGLSGVLVLAWPLFAFGALFMLDAPVRGVGGALLRGLLIGSLLSYPAGGIYAMHLRHVDRLPQREWKRLALFASPCLHLGAVFIAGEVLL
jgi:hypothetical protein